jgi:hypothetical protein
MRMSHNLMTRISQWDVGQMDKVEYAQGKSTVQLRGYFRAGAHAYKNK